MRILLIAYDFPPVPSPQSLRWAYLVRELHGLGHEVSVMTSDLPGYGPGGLPELPAGVQVHRVPPGRISRLVSGRRRPVGNADMQTNTAAPSTVKGPLRTHDWHELNWKGRMRHRAQAFLAALVVVALMPIRLIAGVESKASSLNWKGQIAEAIKALSSRWMFPDYRAEWVPEARRVLRQIVATRPPDIVVTSHEPACSLPVGFTAAELGLHWVVDLGDPILAPYTPPHWRKHAELLERDVTTRASFVSVTTEAAASLLAKRHGVPLDRFLVLQQGFDATFEAGEGERAVDFDTRKLELLYTGSFYTFRRAEALLRAVEHTDRARLTIATISVPDYLAEAVGRRPDKFRLVGFLPHRTALAAQRGCDVLVNLANTDPVQVPGKVYEYLGSGRPVLHIRGDVVDSTSELVTRVGAGWHVVADEAAITRELHRLRALKEEEMLSPDASVATCVAEYSWQRLAGKWSDRASRLLPVVEDGRHSLPEAHVSHG